MSSLIWKTLPSIVSNASTRLQLIADNFTFDDDITPFQAGMLRERHRFAFDRINSCGNLSSTEKTALAIAYQRNIRHSSLNEPGVNARAVVGGSELWVNFGVLFPQGAIEIAQTLIHEMMHCAGFSHPTRRDPNPAIGQSCAAPDPSRFDCPFDNGQYYGTPPLRAEICIAGNQSDVMALVASNVALHSCSVDGAGNCTLYSG